LFEGKGHHNLQEQPREVSRHVNQLVVFDLGQPGLGCSVCGCNCHGFFPVMRDPVSNNDIKDKEMVPHAQPGLVEVVT
jgi:hypothetical protein